METSFLLATFKSWNPEIQRYEDRKTVPLTLNTEIPFGEVSVTLEASPPIIDPMDKGQSVVIWKKDQDRLPQNTHIYQMRNFLDKPKHFVPGKKIMVESPFFYFSDLESITSIQIAQGEPSATSHPDILDIHPVTQIGEKGPGGQLL